MGLGKAPALTPASPPPPEFARLLHGARIAALRASSDPALRKMVKALEEACETTRLAALRNLAQPQNTGGMDRTCGFADLYAALRRARTELGRRGMVKPMDDPSLGRPGSARRPPVAVRASPGRTKAPLSQALA